MAPRSKTPLERVKPEAYPLLSREAVGGLKWVWRRALADDAWASGGEHCGAALCLVGLIAQELPAWREVVGQAAGALISGFPRAEAEPAGYWAHLAHGLMIATVVSGDPRYQGPQPVPDRAGPGNGRTCEQIIAMMDESERAGPGMGRLAALLFDQLYGTDYGNRCPEARLRRRNGSALSRAVSDVDPLGVFAALQIAPIDPVLAFGIYQDICRTYGAQEEDGWHLSWTPGDPRPSPSAASDRLAMAGMLAFAHEFNDVERLQGLRQWFDARYEPMCQDGEFSYTFGLTEPLSLSLANIWATMAHVGEAGAIRRMYNEPDIDKFLWPTVSGVDYPALAVRQAYYDQEKDALVVGTSPGAGPRGAPTSFKVTNLETGTGRVVIVDGSPSGAWAEPRPGEIAVRTTIEDHTFVIR